MIIKNDYNINELQHVLDMSFIFCRLRNHITLYIFYKQKLREIIGLSSF